MICGANNKLKKIHIVITIKCSHEKNFFLTRIKHTPLTPIDSYIIF